MRPLETLLIVSTALAILRRLLFPELAWPSWSPVMPVAIAALFALQVAIEGWRGQMLPAYAVVATWLLFEAAAWSGRLPDGGTSLNAAIRWVAAGGGGLLLAAAAGLAILRPVIETPAPTGVYAVGVTSMALFPDAGPSAASARFYVWYPAEHGTGSAVAPYAIEGHATLRRALLSRGRAMLDATPAGSPRRFPVLVFFPGWGGAPSQNTVLLQDLASHGYVVAAPDAWNPAAYPGDQKAAAELAIPLMFDSEAAVATSMAAGALNSPRQARLARHLLDRLAALDAADPAGRFTGRFDLDHTGMLGFSFGGAIAVETAVDDPRIRAVANLDGGVFTDAYLRGFPQPYLLLNEPLMTEADRHSPDPIVRLAAGPTLEDETRIAQHMRRWGGTRVVIAGMLHGNFTDGPLLNDWRRVGGAIDPRRARAVMNDFILTFFDRHLRGAGAALPPGALPPAAPIAYPEVTLRQWQAPGASQSAALHDRASAQ